MDVVWSLISFLVTLFIFSYIFGDNLLFRLASYAFVGVAAGYAVVIGISRDSIASHDKFKKKYDLSFTLASDEDGKACEAYGTWVEKSMYGRKYMGIERATFLIDAKGAIRNIWRKVKVASHVEEVLAAAKAI